MTDNITDVIEQEPVTTTPTPTESFYASLVGEGKKYKNEEELGRGYVNAEMHMREILDELKEERRDKGVLEEVLKELRSTKPAQTNDVVEPPNDNVSSNPSDVRDMVREALSLEEQEKQIAANNAASLAKLTEVYGSKESGFAAVNAYIGGDKNKREMVDDIGKTDPVLNRHNINTKRYD